MEVSNTCAYCSGIVVGGSMSEYKWKRFPGVTEVWFHRNCFEYLVNCAMRDHALTLEKAGFIQKAFSSSSMELKVQ